jgi:hypothetical protein
MDDKYLTEPDDEKDTLELTTDATAEDVAGILSQWQGKAKGLTTARRKPAQYEDRIGYEMSYSPSPMHCSHQELTRVGIVNNTRRQAVYGMGIDAKNATE